MTVSMHSAPFPLVTPGEADALIGRLMQAMDLLLAMVEQETALVRVGRLHEASEIEKSKSDFARSYVADMSRLAGSSSLSQARPDLVAGFRQRHARFQDLLRINMTVLATAHAVSEDLIRGVSGELARHSAPQTYGSSGRPAAPGPSSIQPLAISRNL
jgi:hypothetical protein